MIVLCLYPLLTDDCLYIFYICTDNVNGWPQNKNICTKLFEECEQKLPADKDQQVQGQLVDNPIEYFLHKIMIYMSKKITTRQLFIIPIFFSTSSSPSFLPSTTSAPPRETTATTARPSAFTLVTERPKPTTPALATTEATTTTTTESAPGI